jgi:diguanylate cyclase (GGDEF)-like protein
VSPNWSSLVTAAAGVLAGLTLAGGLLWHQHQALTLARHDATHDDTTGLPNRRALLTALSRDLTRGRPCGLVLLDLDDFKTINDTLGHEAGNDLLAAVGRRLARLPAPIALAARLSGDEFALLVHGGADATAAAAHRAWQAINTTAIPVGPHDISVHASAGYTTARLGHSVRDLLHHADQAMYQAKTSPSGVAAYNPTATVGRRPGRRCRDRRRW